MKRIKRLWIPLLLGLILMTALVGVASARPDAGPREQAWRVLTIPSTVCIPHKDSDTWSHGVNRVECPSGVCVFFCAVDFPAAGEQAVGAVNVKRVTMYAYDNGLGDAEVILFKSYPITGASVQMASGETATLAADPQTVMDTTIDNNPIYRVQSPLIFLKITVSGIGVYGFHIHYTW
jgi:hypothetical protein